MWFEEVEKLHVSSHPHCWSQSYHAGYILGTSVVNCTAYIHKREKCVLNIKNYPNTQKKAHKCTKRPNGVVSKLQASGNPFHRSCWPSATASRKSLLNGSKSKRVTSTIQTSEMIKAPKNYNFHWDRMTEKWKRNHRSDAAERLSWLWSDRN